MTIYLLDTSVIIDVLNGKHDRDRLLKHLLLEGNLLSCCPINVTEVYAGMRPKEKSRTEALLNSLDYLDVTREIAARAGQLKRAWAEKGVTLSVADVIVAAVALAHNLILITDNTRHYPMPEIRLYPF